MTADSPASQTTNPCALCDTAGFCVRDGACLDAAYSHGSPEIDADAAKLEAMGVLAHTDLPAALVTKINARRTLRNQGAL